MKQKNNFTPEHLKYLRKIKKDKAFVLLMQWVILFTILLVWEVFTAIGILDGFVFSSPSRIFKSIISMFRGGELFLHVGITLYETLAGFFIATALGTIVALTLWWNTRLKRILEPYVVVLNSLPKIALGPVIIIWFGSGTRSIVVMAILITIIVTVITMLSAFNTTEESKVLLLKTFGATKMQILLKLVLPHSLPTFINMLKINVGMSWIGSIMGEYLVSKSGLGYLIVYGGQVFKMDLVFAATLILCALATGMYGIVALIERLALSNREQ